MFFQTHPPHPSASKRFTLLVVATTAIHVFLATSVGSADSFSDELSFLESQNPLEVGRDTQVAAFEQLLADHPHHPDRAKVMVLIADLWQMSDPKDGVQRDQSREVEWLRKARASSSVGSPIWFDAGFRLEGEIFRTSPSEAKQILAEISNHSTGTIIDVKVLYKLQEIAIHEKDYGEAESLCRRLLSWDVNSDDMPKDTLAKGEVFEWIQSGAHSMLIAWSEMGVATDERKAKIEALYNDFRGKSFMDSYRNTALEHLDKLPVIGPTASEAPAVRGTYKWWIWGNVAVIIAIVAYLGMQSFSTKKSK